MTEAEALRKVNEERDRIGMSSVLIDRFYGSQEEMVELLLEENSEPEPTVTKHTLTAAEQRECDSYIRRLEIAHILPGPETCIPSYDSEDKPESSARPSTLFQTLFQKALSNLEVQREQRERELRTRTARVPLELAKTATSTIGPNGNRIEVDVIDGVRYTTEFDAKTGAVVRGDSGRAAA